MRGAMWSIQTGTYTARKAWAVWGAQTGPGSAGGGLGETDERPGTDEAVGVALRRGGEQNDGAVIENEAKREDILRRVVLKEICGERATHADGDVDNTTKHPLLGVAHSKNPDQLVKQRWHRAGLHVHGDLGCHDIFEKPRCLC